MMWGHGSGFLRILKDCFRRFRVLIQLDFGGFAQAGNLAHLSRMPAVLPVYLNANGVSSLRQLFSLVVLAIPYHVIPARCARSTRDLARHGLVGFDRFPPDG